MTADKRLQVFTRVEVAMYSSESIGRVVSLWLLPESPLERAYPGGYASGSWQRIHTLPPLRKFNDIEQAIHIYATTQGWGKYEVFGYILFEGDTDG